VFVASDQIAIGFIKALKNNGVNVPKDVSVVGFDDLDYVKHLEPSLTTIRQNKQLLGEEAADKLLNLMFQNEMNTTGYTKVPVKLIKRDSTKPFKDS
jgi:DNA-binding LacI/PurR family transcriptional regulator